MRSGHYTVLRSLFFSRQSDSSIGIFVDFTALFHFSREFYQSAAPGMAQAKSRGNFPKTLRLARAR
jgi:hypothetical protein